MLKRYKACIAILIIAFLLMLIAPQGGYYPNNKFHNATATFAVATGSYPNEYGEGIFTVIVEENSTGDWLNLGYSSAAQTFRIGQKVLNWTDWANQGVTIGGTYCYTTNATHIMKYTKTGSLISVHNSTGDSDLFTGSGWGMGGLCYYDSFLYVVAHNSDSTNGTVLKYSTLLAFITEYDVPEPTVADNLAMGGISYHDGYFWTVSDSETDHADFQITQYDTSFSLVQAYSVNGFDITGSWHYEGLDWYGDYVFCNIHEGSEPSMIDIYKFTGTQFNQVGRIEQPYFYSEGTYNWLSQDVCIENDGGVYYMWFASRKTTNAQNEVAKYRLLIDSASSNQYDIDVDTDIRLYTHVTLNFTRLSLSYPDDLTLGQNYIRLNISVSVVGTVVFSQDNMTYADSGYFEPGIVWYSYMIILHNVFTSYGTVYITTITYDIYGW